MLKSITLKKSLILLTALFTFSKTAYTDQQRVVLLTSIQTKEKKFLFDRFYFKDYVGKLEQTFIESFSKEKYVIEIIHQANQFDLWNALHDPKNVAVFWLSHMSSARNNSTEGRLFQNEKILDFQGYDVTPVFERIHPNIRFLGMIGCNSKNVMKGIPQTTFDHKHPENPFLRTFTFNKKVNPKKALKIAIAESKKVLEIPEIRQGYSSPCPMTKGYSIQVRREFFTSERIMEKRFGIKALHPAARIMMGDRVLDVFPSGTSNQGKEVSVQNHLIFVPFGSSQSIPKLRIDAGENLHLQQNRPRLDTMELGTLQIELKPSHASMLDPNDSDNPLPIEPWTLWRVANGRPIGTFSRIYKVKNEFKDRIDLSHYLTEQPEFRCEPMPAYE